MTRLLTLPLLLLGFAASAQTAPTNENPRLGLNRPTSSAGITAGISSKPNPVYVVDGQLIDAFQLSDINPDQIASVDVLKGDVAVARYGELARNGVVIVTTKPAGADR